MLQKILILQFLLQAARIKGCEVLKEWVDPIVNHFWYCCQMADGSVEELKVSILSIRLSVSLFIHFINCKKYDVWFVVINSIFH